MSFSLSRTRRMHAASTAVIAALLLGATPLSVVGSLVTSTQPQPAAVGERVSDAGTTVDRSGAATGNLRVIVPPAPSPGSLRKLCLVFLGARRGVSRSTLKATAALVEATGDSPGATTAWCKRYVHRR
jgi:hypothetical protein